MNIMYENLRQYLILMLAISLTFASFLVVINPSFTSTLQPTYFDHLRHQRFAFEFLSTGFSIFNTKMKNLSMIGNKEYYGWLEMPEPYPVGIVLLSIPFAIMAFNGIISPVLLNKVVLLSYLIFAYVDIFLFARYLFTEKTKDLGIKLIILLLFGTWLIFWSLNGQYEAIPILFILLAYRYYSKNDNIKSILFFLFAITFKYQALILSPLFIMPAMEIFKRSISTNEQKLHILSIGILVIIDIYTFYLSLPFFSSINSNPMFYKDIFRSNQSLLQFILFLVTAIVTFIYLYYNNDIVVAISILFIFISFSSISLLQMWYIIWVFPPILFIKNENNGSAVALWMIAFIYILGWIPNYKYIFDVIFSMIWYS